MKYRKEVGSAFCNFVSMTTGLERNRTQKRAISSRKNLVNENSEIISPMFFQRMSIGSEALFTIIIYLLLS